MDNVVATPLAKGNNLTKSDIAFLAFLAIAMVCVGWVGRLAYIEGMNNEITKRNGESWAKWFTQAATDRGNANFQPQECASTTEQVVKAVASMAAVASASPTSEIGAPLTTGPAMTSPAPPPVLNPTPRSWGACLKALTAPGGAFGNMVNPFTKGEITMIPKCDMQDRSLAGGVMLEKIVATPPGSAIPFVNSPLTESDQIDQKMQIRVTVCDKGAYPIRISELEF